jgi:hypothetical protein
VGQFDVNDSTWRKPDFQGTQVELVNASAFMRTNLPVRTLPPTARCAST